MAKTFALLALLLAAIAPAQEPEFAVAPPAKVALPLPEPGATPPAAPAPDAAPMAETAEAPEPAEVDEPPAPTESGDPLLDEIGAAMEESPGTPTDGEATSAAEGTEGPRSLWDLAGDAIADTLFWLCIGLGVYLLAFAAWKRWGRRGPQLGGHELARVVGRVGLSPQASLHFVQVNGEVLVVGVTPQQVNLLKTLDVADLEIAPAPAPVKPEAPLREPAARFLEQLKETRATLGVEPAAVDEDLDKLKGELQRLKQYFQESSRGRD